MALTLRTLGGLSTPEVARAFLVGETTMAAAPRAGQAQDPRRRDPLRACRPTRPAGAPAPAAGRALPDLQRGLPGHRAATPSCAASCATRRSGWPGARRADARRARGAGPAGADAPAPLTPRRAHGRRAASWCCSRIRTARSGTTTRSREGAALAARAGAAGPYSLQAAIAAEHVAAVDRLARVAALYERLAALRPAPVVELNRAVAVAMAEGPERRARAARTSSRAGELADYHLLHADPGRPAAPPRARRGGGRRLPPRARAGGQPGRAGLPRTAPGRAG